VTQRRSRSRHSPGRATRRGAPRTPFPRARERGFPFDERVIEDVRAYGWHFIHVADEHHPEHAESNAALGPHPIHDATFG
jgi:nicotinamidase-related amidase